MLEGCHVLNYIKSFTITVHRRDIWVGVVNLLKQVRYYIVEPI